METRIAQQLAKQRHKTKKLSYPLEVLWESKQKKVKERRLFHQNLSHSMEQIRLSKLSTSALCLYAQKAFCYVCAKNSRIGSNSTKQQKNTFLHKDMLKI